MRIGELAREAGVSTKAIRYYEQLGLIGPDRESNGYRSFSQRDLRAVVEIRELGRLGIAPGQARPFLDCLDAGHEHGDECVSSLAVYRDAIAQIDRITDELGRRRDDLQRRLDLGAGRTFTPKTTPTAAPDSPPATPATPEKGHAPMDYTTLPENLPIPEDDGAAAHLFGVAMPRLELPTSDGGRIVFGGSSAADATDATDATDTADARTVIYLYPLTGRPGVDLPEGWDAIPGARGCSTEACDFRDHFAELQRAGVQRVHGLSSQSIEYQAEVVERLRLPFSMISDESFRLADALKLPTFAAPGHERLYSRLTLVLLGNTIEHVFYPIFPPNTHAQQVLEWLEANPR